MGEANEDDEDGDDEVDKDDLDNSYDGNEGKRHSGLGGSPRSLDYYAAFIYHKNANVDGCDENLHSDHHVDDVDNHGDVDDAVGGPSGPLHYCDLLHTSAPILYPG